ncbi:MAG TPA: hypothetical protein VMF13_10610 [Luteitalea sp.]|nr:hypothetical protein [Luteitalea sp.]
MALTISVDQQGLVRMAVVGEWPDAKDEVKARHELLAEWGAGAVMLDLRTADVRTFPKAAELSTRADQWRRLGMPARFAIVADSTSGHRVGRQIAGLRVARTSRLFRDEQGAAEWLTARALRAEFPARTFLDLDRPDSADILLALQWVVAAANHYDCLPVIACAGAGALDGLASLVDPGARETLRTRHRFDHHGLSIPVRFVSDAGRRSLRDQAVLGLWLTDRDLAVVDDAAPVVMCLVPWLRSHCREWIARHRAVTMADGESVPGATDTHADRDTRKAM